ncbi:MAG: class I SAM-dependent methyltransferase [Synergistaceae bacterium]|jgi:SAM-dependent methyltransferase|nr:class I SAM-dependent methyltransferase [Synergistaceae bacterium]
MEKLPFAEKYASNNPISRYLISHFIKSLSSLVRKVAPRSLLEIGCGEGHLAFALAQEGYSVHGLDVRANAIDLASRHARETRLESRLHFEVGDLYTFPLEPFQQELLICCEVLEHLDCPEAALKRLAELSAEYAIFSVPREPLWCFLNFCRLKYWRSLGNTPGHVNHWSENAFLSFLRARYTVLEVLTPLPWTMALCKKV